MTKKTNQNGGYHAPTHLKEEITMSQSIEMAKQKLYLAIADVRTAEGVWEASSKFMEAATHTNADMNYGSHVTEIKCGSEHLVITLSDDGTLSFRHVVTIEVHSVGGALFKTKPKFSLPLYKSFNVEGDCRPKDAYNDILKDAFNDLIDILFEERIFV
jgi:hypothetical protein